MRYQNINCEPISAPQRFDVEADGLAEALKNALQKTEKNLPKFVHLYPSACSEKAGIGPYPMQRQNSAQIGRLHSGRVCFG